MSHVTRCAAWVCFGICLASGLQADVPVAGMYFLPAGPGSLRTLLVEDGRFVSHSDGAELQGSVFLEQVAAGRGYLRFLYWSGEEAVELRCTWAVLDSSLWVGAFIRLGTVASPGRTAWVSALDRPAFFGARDAERHPRALIFWEPETGRWERSTPAGVRQSSATGVRVLPRPGGLEADGPLVAELPRSGEGPEQIALRRKGDVMLAPWSFRLGTVGLVPRRIEAARLAGEWAGTRRVVVVPGLAPKRPVEEFLGGPRREPGPERLAWSPDARGITWGWRPSGATHPPMGHGDWPFRTCLFAVGEGRLAYYVGQGGCHGTTQPVLELLAPVVRPAKK